MPLLGVIFGGISMLLGATSLGVGISGSSKSKKLAALQGDIGGRQREMQGLVEMGTLENTMLYSGVEATEREGADPSIRVETDRRDRRRALREGTYDEYIMGNRDYSGRTDTTSLLMDLSESAIAGDAVAIRVGAKEASDALRLEEISKWTELGAKTAQSLAYGFAGYKKGAGFADNFAGFLTGWV
jgi:hypothetical protein